MECKEDFNLCFNYFPNKSSFHILDHNFESIGPLFFEDTNHESAASHDIKEEAFSIYKADLI